MESNAITLLHELREKIESLNLTTKEILTLDEAVAYLKISKSYLYKLTHRKEIPFYKPSGKLIYFKKSELDDWVLRNRESNSNEIIVDVLSNLKRNQNG